MDIQYVAMGNWGCEKCLNFSLRNSVSPDQDSSLHIHTLLEPQCNDLHTLVAGYCPRGVGNFIGPLQGGAEFRRSGGCNKVTEGVEGYGMEESGSESLFRFGEIT